MASRNGKASDAPKPRSKVLRERCLLAMNIIRLLSITCHGRSGAYSRRLAHIKLWTLDNTENQYGPAVVALRKLAAKLAHRRRVREVHATTERIGHQLFTNGANELILARNQGLAKLVGIIHGDSGPVNGRVDRRAAVRLPPFAHGVE